MAPIPRRFQPYLDQAAAEAQVRYTPLLQAINQAAADAHSQFTQDVGQAHAAGDLLANSARSTLADVSSPSNPLTQLAQRYQNAPGVTSTVAANLGLTAGSLQSMLAQREAEAGPTTVFQIQNAANKREAALAQARQQAKGVESQYGQYITGRYDSLVGADRKQRHDANQAAMKIAAQKTIANARLAVTKTGQQLAHQDRQAAIQQRRDAAATKAKTQANKSPFSPAARVKAARTIRQGVDMASTYDLPKDLSLAAVRQIMLQGLPDPNNPGKFIFRSVTNDPFLASAIAERYVNGGLAPVTNRRLKNQYGISLKQKTNTLTTDQQKSVANAVQNIGI